MKGLAIFPHDLATRKMSLVRRHHLKAFRRCLGEGNFHVTGPGWPDWRDGETLQENVDRIMPDAEFLWGYKVHEGIKSPDVHKQPLVVAYNEAWWPDDRAKKEVLAVKADVVICHHLSDMKQFDGCGALVTHIPHAADPDLFCRFSKPWREREIDVLVTGALDKEIYPFRTKMAEVIRSGGLLPLNAVVHKHPGYRLRDEEACLRQDEEYAKLLGNTKISIVCGSKYNYGLAKYFESFMAGCYVLGTHVNDTYRYNSQFDTGGSLVQGQYPGGCCFSWVNSDADIPERMQAAFDLIDAICTGSEFSNLESEIGYYLLKQAEFARVYSSMERYASLVFAALERARKRTAKRQSH